MKRVRKFVVVEANEFNTGLNVKKLYFFINNFFFH